jgi:hypothetical protein
MAGEFVRTPKHGVMKGRYRARADLPLVETLLSLLSFAAVIASIETGHYFATPFALLFTIGYGYISVLIAHEQASRRRAAALAGVDSPANPPARTGTENAWSLTGGLVGGALSASVEGVTPSSPDSSPEGAATGDFAA